MNNPTIQKKTRKVRSLETKIKIYKAATALFSQEGFEKVSVERIARAAGVAKGSVYVHYPSKYALISELTQSTLSGIDMSYTAFIRNLPANIPVSEAMLTFVDKISDVLTEQLGYDLMKITYSALLERNAAMSPIISYSRNLYQNLMLLIEQGVNRGEFAPIVDAESLSKHLILAIRGLTYEWLVRYPDFDLKANVHQHFVIMLDGIKKR